MNRPSSIHFVGIKGVGMAPLAIIAKEAGFNVSGCDINETFITDEPLKKAGIISQIGFFEQHVKDVDLVITTGAHGGFENIEVVAAKKGNILVMTQGEAVGVFMDGKIFGRKNMQGISVTGTHGKTTTTAMIATVLKVNGMDPSYVVGTGNVPSLGTCGHYGKGNYFVAEADEYATEPVFDKTPKFMWQHPKIAVFTNMELDHPDLYPSIDMVRNAFFLFTKNIKEKLVACGDDKELKKLISECMVKTITYGFEKNNEYVVSSVSIRKEKTLFTLSYHGVTIGRFILSVAGEHNALNATAAIIVALQVGIKIDSIKQSILEFSGSKRRLEFIGSLPTGALLYDDYAHHPTEIRATLKTVQQMYPKKKIVCVFQPHTYSRTKKLFEEFIHSFTHADTVILTNIYPSLREKPDLSVSSELLAREIKNFNSNTVFLPSEDDVVKYIKKQGYLDNVILLTIGAGSIYTIARPLLEHG